MFRYSICLVLLLSLVLLVGCSYGGYGYDSYPVVVYDYGYPRSMVVRGGVVVRYRSRPYVERRYYGRYRYRK